MLFSSFDFLIFFPIVVMIYFIIPKNIKYLWLLITSYYFYLSWSPKFTVLIMITTCITWIASLCLNYFKKTKKSILQQKLCIVFCCIINLGILCFFKYFDFVLENVNLICSKMGLEIIEKPFDIVLPLGISFYTFQSISYIIDVYRGNVKAEKNLAKYALFISFFPKLITGPIERAYDFFAQINNIPNIKVINYSRITDGLIYMLYGFFLKMVITDRISIMVDTVFNSWYIYGTVELIAAAIGFSIQIYCDFSSYSIIAIGAAQVMGFNLMENFQSPYFSRSIKEFWHCWHISLSTWFRDYLYIPMGGNRCSILKKNINILVTFIASGLWHGANWTFVLWGGIHGLYQIIGGILEPMKKKIYPYCGIRLNSISYKVGQVITTFILTSFAWIFFRAKDISSAFGYIRNIFLRWNPWAISDKTIYNIGLSNYEWNILFISLLLLIVVDMLKKFKGMRIDTFLNTQGTVVKGFAIMFMLLMIAIFGKYGGEFDAKQFIYFQF